MKRVVDTSRDAFKDVRADLARRHALILDGICRYWREYYTNPTAYELLKFLQAENPALDVNGIRPRLTELEASGRVAKGEKRRCTITGKTVYTWSVVTPSSVPAPFVERLPLGEVPRQMGLL